MNRLFTAALILLLNLGVRPIRTHGDEPDTEITSTVEGIVFMSETRDEAIASMRKQLEKKIKLLRLSYDLNPDLDEQLKFAGRGDIERFFNRVDILAAKFSGYTTDNLRNDQQQLGPLSFQAMQLQREQENGVFGPESLFQKVLRTQMGEEQWTQLSVSERTRKHELTQALASTYVISFEHIIPMTAEQVDRLTKLLAKALEHDQVESRYASFIVTCRLVFIPESVLAEFLDEKQLAAFRNRRIRDSELRASLIKAGMMQDSNVDEP